MRRIQVESFLSFVWNGLQHSQGGVPMRRVGTRALLKLMTLCLIYGFLCHTTESVPPPTPSLKKGEGFPAVSRRGAWQITSGGDHTRSSHKITWLFLSILWRLLIPQRSTSRPYSLATVAYYSGR